MKRSFKCFYTTNTKTPEMIFEKSFDLFYARGYFGNIKKSLIQEQQWDWFIKLKLMVENKDVDGLCHAVGHRDSRFSRDLFEKLTGLVVIGLKRKDIKVLIEKFCE